MMKIPAKSIDMILCDLPYGTTQNHWDSYSIDQLGHYERIIKTMVLLLLRAGVLQLIDAI